MRRNGSSSPVVPVQDGSPLIQMRGITKVFRSTAGEFTVLKSLDVDVRPGEFVSVIGRSGSGKSTLVNMLTGIDHPTSGTVRVGNSLLTSMRESQMSVWRGRNLGIVFQFFQLLPMLTLIENVMLPMDFCNMYAPSEREERALSLLERVGLLDFAHKLPGAVSGGQQQSAAVARALANDPPILVADEPTGNLDSRTAEEVIQLFEELVAQGKTILMVTHDRALALRTTRMLVISDGELVDESISRALPDLPHEAMLALTHQAQRFNLAPSADLAARPDLEQRLFVISKGRLDLTRRFKGNGEESLEFFEEGSLLDPAALRGKWGSVQMIAGQAGVDLLAFDRAASLPLLTDSAPTLAPEPQPAPRGPIRRWFGRGRRTS